MSPEEIIDEAKPSAEAAPAAAATAAPATSAPASAAPGAAAKPAKAAPSRPAQEPDRTEYMPYDRPPSYPQPTRKQLFTTENTPSFMGLGLLIGIILLFIGTMFTAVGMFVEVESSDDEDLQRNLLASGVLIDGIGLFLAAIFIVLPLLLVKNIGDKQKTFMILLLGAIIIGFALLAVY